MSISSSKRNFLLGLNFRKQPARPPWSLSEQDFVDTCIRCDSCIDECHVHVIRKGSGGFPEMDFSDSGCDFCEVCVEVCEPHALDKSGAVAFKSIAHISAECFSERGVICRSCSEVCEARAIQFKQKVGGVSQLFLNTSTCNGCGECISICPARAITMKHIN